MRVLVVNAGSSSVKLTLLDGDDSVLASRQLDAPRARVDPSELDDALGSALAAADAVGHRIVHGGERYRRAMRIDAEVRSELEALCDLAPLHQPKSLAALDAVSAALPALPAVACFDTAFHSTLTAAARTYALPAAWRERWGLRRYGFHGLSHAWVARRAAQMLACEKNGPRLVSCHLGAGASLCAIRDGRSVDTTMGFTPLEGLVMATRSGNVDPGLLTWLLERCEVSIPELNDALEHGSGLLGLSGSADMKEVTRAAAAGAAAAQLALDVYVHRLRAAIAAMAASMNGLDALAFTGGVGERSAEVRSRTAAGLRFLDVALEEPRNELATSDCDISAPGARVRTLVITAREDLEIADQTRAALAEPVPAPAPPAP
ncbi:MAG TPA: acetate/propionate family kinase [Solirubrobacteraceae bacterium]|nr:acetate/propionate family kinase [Solirubrobacteraceae bacterium]